MRRTQHHREQGMKLTDDEICDLAMQAGAYDGRLLAYARAIESTVRQQYEPVLQELVEVASALLKKIHRDAPDLSGKLMGELEAALTAAQRLLDDA